MDKGREAFLRAIAAYNAKLAEVVTREKWPIKDIVELCDDLKLQPLEVGAQPRRARPHNGGGGGGKGLSRYGHRMGTMAAAIDDLLWKGVHIVDATKTLAVLFNRTEDAARSKFLGHVHYLPKVRHVGIKESNGFYKADVDMWV